MLICVRSPLNKNTIQRGNTDHITADLTECPLREGLSRFWADYGALQQASVNMHVTYFGLEFGLEQAEKGPKGHKLTSYAWFGIK